MEDDESSGQEEEPPSPEGLAPTIFILWCLLVTFIVTLLVFYPIKISLILFIIYATYVGYKEDQRKTKARKYRK